MSTENAMRVMQLSTIFVVIISLSSLRIGEVLGKSCDEERVERDQRIEEQLRQQVERIKNLPAVYNDSKSQSIARVQALASESKNTSQELYERCRARQRQQAEAVQEQANQIAAQTKELEKLTLGMLPEHLKAVKETLEAQGELMMKQAFQALTDGNHALFLALSSAAYSMDDQARKVGSMAEANRRGTSVGEAKQRGAETALEAVRKEIEDATGLTTRVPGEGLANRVDDYIGDALERVRTVSPLRDVTVRGIRSIHEQIKGHLSAPRRSPKAPPVGIIRSGPSRVLDNSFGGKFIYQWEMRLRDHEPAKLRELGYYVVGVGHQREVVYYVSRNAEIEEETEITAPSSDAANELKSAQQRLDEMLSSENATREMPSR